MANAVLFTVYRCQTKELLLVTPTSESIWFTLQPSSFELFTITPVTTIGGGAAKVRFALVGLVDLLNCGVAIVDVQYGTGGEVRMKVKGAGRLLVYSDVKRRRDWWMAERLNLNGENGGKLMVDVTWKQEKDGVSDVAFCF